MDGPPATIYVVDDDADVRATLAGLLRSVGYEPRTFASGTEFLAAHEPELSGCIILDLSVPGCSGLDILTRLTESGCHRPIIFLTANGSIRASVRAIKAGAVNFLTKPVEEEELFTAVEEALLIDAMRREQESCALALALRLKRLTPREREVLELVIAGRLNKQIAGDLGIAEKTIKVHRARVMHKMGARSLAELVRLAALAGISSELPGHFDLPDFRLPICTSSRPFPPHGG